MGGGGGGGGGGGEWGEGSANKKMKCPEPTDYVRCLLSETDESST